MIIVMIIHINSILFMFFHASRNSPMPTRKEFYTRWVAKNLGRNDRMARQWTCTKRLSSVTSGGLDWGWKSKAFLVAEWGEKKLENK